MGENEIRVKAKDIMSKLTLEEKIGMIHGSHLFSTKGVERLGIPPLVMSDGPLGVRQEFEPDHWKTLGYSDDYVTYLPCNSALAATWNRDMAYAMGSVLGEEARGRNKDVILAPGINIKRSPLCGRNFEYFSEDPYLTGELASAFIHGVQQWDVAACVKHFAVNNQETQRLWVNVEIEEKALREIYLPAFYECLVKGGSLTVMGAYNQIYGEHCCQSEYLLQDILRKEWGYEGVVISDWGAVHDTEMAGMSQLDIEMSVTDNFQEYFMADPLKKAVEDGKVPESKINEKVIRILMLMLKLHMIKDEKGIERKNGTYNTLSHRQTALEIARESIVLLKNEDGLLPLCAEKIKNILVIGENAERLHANGGGSAEIKALYEISPLMGIRMLLGSSVQIDYVKGYESGEKEIGNKESAGDVNWQEKSLEAGGGHSLYREADNRKLKPERARLRREAAVLAGKYDKVIFVGGLNHDYDSEGLDRRDMKLPYEQDLLIKELLKVRQDVILAFVGGSPVEMGEWIGRAKAVVWSYYAGMEGGNALAEVLFGKVNPAGKLPETFYKNPADCSAHSWGEFAGEKSVAYKEGIFVGYRYSETFGAEPEFCFGHGLSYTEFVYEDAVYEEADGYGYVICKLTNIGPYAGGEVVQVYALNGREGQNPKEDIGRQQEKAAGLRPLKELAGFGKIYLEAGETGQVKISVRNIGDKYGLGVGRSVKDIRLFVFG